MLIKHETLRYVINRFPSDVNERRYKTYFRNRIRISRKLIRARIEKVYKLFKPKEKTLCKIPNYSK